MTRKVRQNAGKKIWLFSELFIINIFKYTFVSFEHNQTIVISKVKKYPDPTDVLKAEIFD
jgi:hypothetical protein